MSQPMPLRALLLGLAGVVIFAATLPLAHVALRGFSPLFLTFGRAVIAALCAGAWLLLRRRRLPRALWGRAFAAGLCVCFGFPAFSNIAMQTVPAAHGGIVLGVLPLMTAAFAALIGGERPGAAFWGWSITGAALVLAFTLRGSDLRPSLGDLWLLCAALSASCGYVLLGGLSRVTAGWEAIGWALVTCLPISALGTALLWQSGIHAPGLPELLAFAYHALFSMFLGFVFWNAGLALGGIARVGQLQLFQTFFTLAFSAALLGERVSGEMIGWASAVALVVWAGRKAQVGQARSRTIR